MKKFISYDLGTGGAKASLYDESLNTLARSFVEYETEYPQPDYHEQSPQDWWKSIVKSTKKLLKETQANPEDIVSLAISGASLVTVPLDAKNRELIDKVPIWSDKRAKREAEEFFSRFDEEAWYMRTGNGFPAPCYSVFKLMWMKKNQPEIYQNMACVLGSKDYINFRLTGKCYMDYSYASGTGAYELIEKKMSKEILAVAGIKPEIFPEIVPSDFIIGTLLPSAAEELGLSEKTAVACGGVDNACMALGSIANKEGSVYSSLGSSSWIAVNSRKPVLDAQKRPYIFAHIDDSMYTSAFSIFAGGSSLRWVRDNLCKDIINKENAYDIMTNEMLDVPEGAGGVIFNPSLAGGTSQDKSINIRGGFVGLDLGTNRAAMIRASMEGIAMNLKLSLEELERHTKLGQEIQFCGGGAKNKIWMQMFADIFNKTIIKTNIDQDAASLGAAAIAAKAVGALEDYHMILDLHKREFECWPRKEKVEIYKRLLKIFVYTSNALADLGDFVKQNC